MEKKNWKIKVYMTGDREVTLNIKNEDKTRAELAVMNILVHGFKNERDGVLFYYTPHTIETVALAEVLQDDAGGTASPTTEPKAPNESTPSEVKPDARNGGKRKARR